MRPVGVGSKVERRRHGQADMVALWLGTFELLKDETMQSGHVISNDALCLATTSLVAGIDLNEPWIGRHVPPGTGYTKSRVDE